MKEKVIALKNISKTYNLFSITDKNKKTNEEFFALKEINLSVKKGDTLGLVGPNGCGKTTLLKIISKIIEPSSGKVKTKGDCAPSLEMGVGFHEDLTAKENIFLSGIIMGIPKRKLKRELDEILEFAGVKKFSNMPLKKFSSGMKVRLSFSILRKINAEIYLFDEILAVGDERFRKKAIKIFKKMKKQKKTVILVSHNLEIVESYCDKVILLKKGKITAKGSPKKVIKIYKNGKYK